MGRIIFVALFMAFHSAFAIMTWQPLPGISSHPDHALLDVGSDLWIATDSGITVTDGEGKPGVKMDRVGSGAGPAIDLRREPGRILARFGSGYQPSADYGWWSTPDSGRNWRICDSVCIDPFPKLPRLSTYPLSGGSQSNGVVETPASLLFTLPGGILRRVKAPVARWEIAMMEKTPVHGTAFGLQREAQGILLLEPQTFFGGDFTAMPRLAMRSVDEGLTWKPVDPSQSRCMTAVESRGVRICSEDGGLSLSRDEGKTWSDIRVTPAGSSGSVRPWILMSVAGPWVVASFPEVGSSRVFYSEDAGLTWHDRTPPSSNLTSVNYPRNAFFVMSGGHAILGGRSMYVTLDSGRHWQEKPLPGTDIEKHYYAMAGSRTRLWIITESGRPFFSTDLGSTWKDAIFPVPPKHLRAKGDLMVMTAAQGDSSLLSMDEGATWETIPSSFPRVNWKMAWQGRLWAGTDLGLFASPDSGASWRLQEFPGASPSPVFGGDFRGDSLLIASARGVFLGTGGGSSWRALEKWEAPMSLFRVRLSDNAALAWKENDWLKVYAGDSVIRPIPIRDRSVLGAAFSGKEPRWITNAGLFGLRTGETAPHWFAAVHGSILPGAGLQGLAAQEDVLVCLTKQGLFQSADSGARWTLQPGPARDYGRPGRLVPGWKGLLVSDASGIWYRARLRDAWSPLLTAAETSDTLLFASDSLIAIGGSKGVRLRGPGDSSWRAPDSLPGKLLGIRGMSLYAGTENRFHMSDDAGATWRSVVFAPCGGTGSGIELKVMFPGKILAVYEGLSKCVRSEFVIVNLSEDGGHTWAKGDTGTAFDPFARPLESMQSGELSWWKARANWVLWGSTGYVSPPNALPIAMAFSGRRLFAAYPSAIMWTDAFADERAAVALASGPPRQGGLPRLSLRRGAGGTMRAYFIAPHPMHVSMDAFDTRGRAVYRSASRAVAAGPVDWPLPALGSGPWILRLRQASRY